MKVYELLADPKRWTKGAYARNEHGTHVAGDDPNAVCWCLLGATYKCYGGLDGYTEVLDRLYSENDEPPAIWQDRPERTHAEVLELVTRLGI